MHIIDNEQRRFVDQDFDTHKEAVARLAELIEEDPRAEVGSPHRQPRRAATQGG
jgi:hypothetical protein